MATALIVDQDMETVLSVAELFREEGFATETANDLEQARKLLLKDRPEVAMFAERIGTESSLAMLEDVDLTGIMEIYLLSEGRSLDTAIHAMRIGICDYFEKPIDSDRLRGNLRLLNEEIECAVDGDAAIAHRGRLIGESPPMQRLYRLIRKCAPSDASILVSGESGVGKELVARLIHELSDRSACELIAFNCSAIPHELMESELFGHVKGSFTGATANHKGFFERAAGGTLFFDEITEMDEGLQAKLLRALETHRVRPVGAEKDIDIDVRIIAATNVSLKEALEEGKLREDLYYRLAQFPLNVPALRDRDDDVLLLADHFLQQHNEKKGTDKTFSEDVIELFRLHQWPGNVRELKNAVIHGYLLAGNVIEVEDLPETTRGIVVDPGAETLPDVGVPISEVERRHVLATLEYYDGDKKRAAETLGISLKTLYNKLKLYEKSSH